MPIVTPVVGQPLSPEQQKYVNSWSFGAFGLGIFYCLANGLLFDAFLMLVPIVNIINFFRMIIKGRQLAWEKSAWLSFEHYQKRQRLLDRLAVIWVILTLVLSLGTIGIVVYSTQGPANAATEIFTELSAGQANRVYQEASPEFRRSVDVTTFQKTVATLPEFTNFSSVSFSSRGISSRDGSTQSNLGGTLTTKDGQTYPVRITLRKIGDRWSLVSFELTSN